MSNKLAQFWKELKNRNVPRICTLYIAVAFGLMELVDIVSGSLNLPAWVLTAVILLSAVGLPVTIILTWMFLVTPEGIRRYRHVIEEILVEKKEEHQGDQGETYSKYSFADGLIFYESDIPEFATLGKKSKRRGMVYGLSSIPIAGLVVVFFLFYSGKSVPFQERNWMVLADFVNHTGEEIFDQSLNTAFEISIDQSRYINVIPRQRMQEALKRIGQNSGAVINERISREIAIREGAKVYVIPEISRVGHRYILTGRLMEAESGRVVASEVYYSENRDEVINRMDHLSRKIRRHLGESRYRISGQSKPLAKVTTGSLDALKQFSLGIESQIAMNFELAAEHYRNAIGLDSSFTAAKASLGNVLYEQYNKAEGIMWLEEAMLTMDDLTEREKNGIKAFYAANVEKDLDQAIRYTKLNIELYPDDQASRNNLGWYLMNQGYYREATEHYRKAISIDPYAMLPYGGLNWIYNEFTGEADSVIFWANRMLQHGPDNAWAYFYLGSGYFARDSTLKAEEAYERCAELQSGLAINQFRLANTKRVLGKYEEAVQALEDVLEFNPTYLNAYYQMGINYELMGRAEEAEANYRRYQDLNEKWLDSNPEDLGSIIFRGLVLTRLGDKERGLRAGEEAYRLDSSRHMNFAMLLAVQGDIDQALEQVELALETGYRDYCWLKMNPDLAGLQEEERFRKLLNQYFNQ